MAGKRKPVNRGGYPPVPEPPLPIDRDDPRNPLDANAPTITPSPSLVPSLDHGSIPSPKDTPAYSGNAGTPDPDAGWNDPNPLAKGNSPDLDSGLGEALFPWLAKDPNWKGVPFAHDDGFEDNSGPSVSVNDPNANTLYGHAGDVAQNPPNIEPYHPDSSSYMDEDSSFFDSGSGPTQTSEGRSPYITPAQGPPARQASNQIGGQNFRAGFNLGQLHQLISYPAGPIRPNDPVNAGQVLIGNENSSASGDAGANFNPIEASSAAERAGDQETANLKATGQLTPDGLTPGQPGALGRTGTSNAPVIGIGTSTDHNASLGTANNPLFGVGASGQHYFNAGGGWQPIGNAPTDVRWASNSGTGNSVATDTTNAYVASGGDPGAPNNTGNTGDSGHDIFSGGQFVGNAYGGEVSALPRSAFAGQGPALAPWAMAPQLQNNGSDPNAVNAWLAQNNQGNMQALAAWQAQHPNSPASNILNSIPGGG